MDFQAPDTIRGTNANCQMLLKANEIEDIINFVLKFKGPTLEFGKGPKTDTLLILRLLIHE